MIRDIFKVFNENKERSCVTMTIRDGFKFGVGYFLGTSTIAVLVKLIAETCEKKPTNTEDDEEKIWKPEEVTE